jgi:agmatinase
MLYLRKTFSYEYPAAKADVVLIGVPFDGTETGKPVRYGPVFLREAIKNLPGYDTKANVSVFERFKIADVGDVEVVPGSWKLTGERIRESVKWVLEQNPKALPVFLGGEHLITLGILEGMKPFLKEKVTVVHFDAHRDLLTEYMGEGFSHITWAYHIAKDPAFRLVQIGCRSWSREEEANLKRLGVKETVNGIKGPVYLSIDMDVFDPAYAPEVGTPEPEGVLPGEFFKMLGKIPAKDIIGMDIVECASDRVNTPTAALGAHIFKRVLGMKGVSK